MKTALPLDVAIRAATTHTDWLKPHDDGRRRLDIGITLALRATLIRWLSTEKPYLIQRCTPEGIFLYGDSALLKAGKGIAIKQCSKTVDWSSTSVSRLARDLVDAATRQIRIDYADRLKVEVDATLAQMVPGQPDVAVELRDFVTAHIEWVFSKKMQPRWWGKTANVPALTGYINKKAWELGIFDRRIWGYALRVFGNTSNLGGYNDTARKAVELEARLTETPNLASLLVYPAQWDKTLKTAPDTIASARNVLVSCGCTPKGWRWLTRQSATWVSAFATFNPDNLASALNLLAEHQVGKLPKNAISASELVRQLTPYDSPYARLMLPPEVLAASFARVLALLTAAFAKRQIKVPEMNSQLGLIMDYVRAGNAVNKGATLSSLMRRQDEWHCQQYQRKLEELKATRALQATYAWEPLVPEVKHKQLRAVSLNTTEELWDEGDRMRHCVGGTYHLKCFANKARIYTLLAPDATHQATLEVTHYKGTWQKAQLRGVKNGTITDPEVLALAAAVLKAVRKAPMPKLSANRLTRAATPAPHYPVPSTPCMEELEDGVYEALEDDVPF